ncbi:signal peptide peptidase SppA [Limobrevibacterium gyesilva]|uniref:Signal peptide peptidase SppA n=1 Tax=Limobrevibacterium gyesilva TaxID=2991712 RepID=A0AA41YWN8_9PROT|nr:signal peptide peptidase SppA [Limobrevibacterium gyesilva]MCW3477863.1 signal peptide peptidase SppA [Limobrevibacterium gyesilva]
MSLETDLLMDRRRLKRRLLFWRVLAVLAVAACALALFGRNAVPIARDHVARLSVTGVITEQRKLTEAVTALGDDSSAKALIVSIDSPGGSVAGGEALHDAIAKVAKKKPVVAVMGGTAASAGYMIALPAARIYAREATLTGSIGVLLPTGEISGLLRMLGITDETIKSGPLKDEPSFTRPMTEQGRAVLQELVMDMYDQFVTMVADGRQMDLARVRELADGRAYTGRQAMKLGLVDAIGGEAEARSWLARAKGVPEALPVRDVRIGGLRQRLLGDSAEGLLSTFLKTVLSQGLRLDGAWAVWQPSISRD